jgi:hypothetical protein
VRQPHRIHIPLLLALALHSGLAAAASEVSSSDAHFFDVRYNVALVEVGAITPTTGDIDGLAAENPAPIGFDNAAWSAAGVGAGVSDFITRESTLSYTLAGGRNAMVTVNLGAALPGALRMWLRTTEARPVGVTATAFWGRAAATAEGLELSAAAANAIVVDGDNGVHDESLPIFYDFQIDVTAGPAFGPTLVTVVFTAQADAAIAP